MESGEGCIFTARLWFKNMQKQIVFLQLVLNLCCSGKKYTLKIFLKQNST